MSDRSYRTSKMDFLEQILPCCGWGSEKSEPSLTYEKEGLLDSDTKAVSYNMPMGIKTVHDAALEVTQTLEQAEKAGKSLEAAINDIATQAGGWTERIAAAILAAVATLVKEGVVVGQAMKEAYNKACEAAEVTIGFIEDHPVLCTVIAIGILVILAPYVIEALGFGLDGPIAGSWAAAWQSTYGGYVEAGSLFSYLQRLGMTWKLVK